ncbi:MAG: hypothetical protein IPI66_10360 [Chitinophagaceae bacterium]|nr:hypothetical protein [Chitinophagaceae bacterium]
MNPRTRTLIVGLFLWQIIQPSLGLAQTTAPFFGNIVPVNGYAREMNGETLNYFSAFPDHATQSLLTRATNGTKWIEWETGPVPGT